MGFFNFRKKQPLILEERNREDWAQQIAEHRELTKQLAQFRKDLRQKQVVVKAAAQALRRGKADVPERAQHITDQHAKTLAQLCDQTVDEIQFESDILKFQDNMDAAIAALQYYKEHSSKNVSALREYYQEQLTALAEGLQALEDVILKTGAKFDEQQLQSIMQIQELTKKLTDELIKKNRYEKTLAKYVAEQERNTDKQQKHELRIEEQKQLVREMNALSALKKIKDIETQDHEIKASYERLVFDTKHYILKNELTLNETSKRLFDDLKRNADGTLKGKSDTLKKEFEELYEALNGLGQEDTKDVVGRLRKAAKNVVKDAQKLVNNEEVLHELKKQVIHDVAALNIYEQEQFLLRARQEAAEHTEKLQVLTEALDELQDEAIKQELYQLAKQFNAIIKHNVTGEHL